MGLEQRADRVEVVVFGDQCLRGVRLGHAGAGRHAQGRRAGARLHEHAVGVPVVVAVELEDLGAAREGARDADRAHHGLGAGADEP